LAIPVPVASGTPGEGYPYPWSVYRWLDGEVAGESTVENPAEFAVALAQFLRALHRVDPSGGPAPGKHNFFRGASPAVYAGETVAAIDKLGGEIPGDAVRRVWDQAVAAPWDGDPVWFHGDVAAGNLLTRGGKLSAVIDFGCAGVGDPACDIVIAWTFFHGAARDAFRRTLQVEDATWARGRGWALWKALIGLADALEHDSGDAEGLRQVIAQLVLDDG
jgi:aminoglycoside phosphotransferase (APT) family kinase protein